MFYTTTILLLLGPTSTATKLKTTMCDNFKMARDKMSVTICQLLLITNSKSHTVFRLVPPSVILNDLERRNSPYVALFYRIR